MKQRGITALSTLSENKIAIAQNIDQTHRDAINLFNSFIL